MKYIAIIALLLLPSCVSYPHGMLNNDIRQTTYTIQNVASTLDLIHRMVDK